MRWTPPGEDARVCDSCRKKAKPRPKKQKTQREYVLTTLVCDGCGGDGGVPLARHEQGEAWWRRTHRTKPDALCQSCRTETERAYRHRSVSVQPSSPSAKERRVTRGLQEAPEKLKAAEKEVAELQAQVLELQTQVAELQSQVKKARHVLGVAKDAMGPKALANRCVIMRSAPVVPIYICMTFHVVVQV